MAPKRVTLAVETSSPLRTARREVLSRSVFILAEMLPLLSPSRA